MKRPPLRSLLKSISKFSLAAAAAVGLNGCGGSSGGGDGPPMVAPASLDEVNINFFQAFNLECFRLSGTRGNEFGAVKYTSPGGFRFALKDSSGALESRVALPRDLTDVRYSYLRTGPNSGRLELTWTVVQAYPYPAASANNAVVTGLEMFWFGSDPGLGVLGEQRVVVDMLFSGQGGVVGEQIARIKEAVRYTDVFGSDEHPRWSGFEFDSPDVLTFSARGGQLPINYDPYSTINDETPAKAVWTTMRRRIVDFRLPSTQSPVEGVNPIPGALVSRMSFLVDSSVTNPPPLPRGTAEETGRVLIDDVTAGVQARDGAYSYRRTGGDRALLSVRFEGPAPDRTETFRHYDMDFDSLEAGVFVESVMGTVGEFEEDRDLPGP